MAIRLIFILLLSGGFFNKNNAILPEWYLQPDPTDNYIYATGISDPGDGDAALQQAVDRARIIAGLKRQSLVNATQSSWEEEFYGYREEFVYSLTSAKIPGTDDFEILYSERCGGLWFVRIRVNREMICTEAATALLIISEQQLADPDGNRTIFTYDLTCIGKEFDYSEYLKQDQAADSLFNIRISEPGPFMKNYKNTGRPEWYHTEPDIPVNGWAVICDGLSQNFHLAEIFAVLEGLYLNGCESVDFKTSQDTADITGNGESEQYYKSVFRREPAYIKNAVVTKRYFSINEKNECVVYMTLQAEQGEKQ